MKYRSWASLLAISLCLTGISGCDGSPQTAEASGDTQTVEVMVNGQPTRISINVEEIKRTHQTYSEAIDPNLIEPLRVIADKPAEERDRAFVDSANLNPKAVDVALGSFLASLSSVVELESQFGEDFQTESESTLDSLRSAKEAAEEVREKIVKPLLPEEQDSSTGDTQPSVADLFVIPESESKDAQQKSVIGSIQRNIPPSENGATSEVSNFAESIGDQDVGKYGNSTFSAINVFLLAKNTLIGNSVSSLNSLTGEGEPGGEDVTQPDFLSLAALILGLANTSGLCFLFYRLLNREEAADSKATNAIDAIANNQASLNRKDKSLEKVSSSVKKLQYDYDSLKQEFQDLSREIDIIHSEREQSIAQHQQTTVETPYYPSDAGRATPSMTVGAGSSGRGQSQPTAYDPPQTPPKTLSSAEIYNQNPESFERVATVAVSESSQRLLWVGKKVTPTFSQRAQGDYWVITQDKQIFYLVIKDQAPINENNLETLGIIYQFENGSNLSSLRRKYSNLAEVTLQGNEWLLKRSGSLVFY